MRNLRRIQRRNHNFDTISWNPNRKQEHGTDQEGQFIWPASMGQLRTGRYMLRRASGSGWDRAWLCRQKKSSFLGSPRDVFGRPSAAPEPMAPKFLHTTFPSRYFVLAEFHPPRLSFGGVMPPTPSFASLQYGLPYTIWQAIKIKRM